MAEPQKVPLYSLNDLKNATDDALAPYLTTLPAPYKFKQSHYLANVRLAVGYTTVTIAAILFAADYKLGWDATKAYTGPACLAYFVLNGFLTLWIWKVESGTVFVGERQGGQKLTLSSSVQKHKPIYKLHVKYEAPSGKIWDDRTIQAPFNRWFSSDGFIQTAQLKQWLATNIEPIGLADPKSTTSQYETENGDTVVVGDSDLSDPASATKTPRSRKSKKKA